MLFRSNLQWHVSWLGSFLTTWFSLFIWGSRRRGVLLEALLAHSMGNPLFVSGNFTHVFLAPGAHSLYRHYEYPFFYPTLRLIRRGLFFVTGLFGLLALGQYLDKVKKFSPAPAADQLVAALWAALDIAAVVVDAAMPYAAVSAAAAGLLEVGPAALVVNLVFIHQIGEGAAV